MARADVLKVLYSKEKSRFDFNFDALMVPSMHNFLSPNDISQLRNIAISLKLSSKIETKYKMIDDILRNRGFRKIAAGTNRVVYGYPDDHRFVIKVAVDRVGMKDNPNEWNNQFLLKPFVTKVFEVSPCGTVAMVEKVEPVMSKEEYKSIAEDVFNLLNMKILGKYVLEDIGTKYFMNWGTRIGFGPVLLDFPYVFELDGNKLHCNKVFPDGIRCNGIIDYDDGFNKLYCEKCGKEYFATELKKNIENKTIILKEINESPIHVKIYRGDKLIKDLSNPIKSSNSIK